MGKNSTTSAQFLLQTTGASTAAPHPFLLIHYIYKYLLLFLQPVLIMMSQTGVSPGIENGQIIIVGYKTTTHGFKMGCLELAINELAAQSLQQLG